MLVFYLTLSNEFFHPEKIKGLSSESSYFLMVSNISTNLPNEKPKINTHFWTTSKRENGEKHKGEAIFILLFDNLAKMRIFKNEVFSIPAEPFSPLQRRLEQKKPLKKNDKMHPSQRMHLLVSCLSILN